MATGKKAKKARKAKTKRAGKPAAKPVARKKLRAVRKAPAKKKPAPKKKAVRKIEPVRKKETIAKKKAPAPATAPVPAPLVGEERVGVVTHYYNHLGVAAVRIDTLALRVGDTIHVVGHTSDFRQKVESMQLEHESVAEALPEQEIGLRVTEHAREHDIVYKVRA